MKKDYAYGRVPETVTAFEILSEVDELEGPEDYKFKTKNHYGEECMDIDKLRIFIIFDYLPRNRKINKIGKAKNIESVTFSSLLNLKLSQSEMIEVLKMLEKLNVCVTGYTSLLNDSLDQIQDINRSVDIYTGELFRTFPKYDPFFGNVAKIKEYQKEKDPDRKKELRDMIVENNCRLVPYCMFKSFRNIPEFYKYDIAQEALMALTVAVDNFDASLAGKFSTYAYSCIRYSILTSLNEIMKVTSRKSGEMNNHILRDLKIILEAEHLDDSYMFKSGIVEKLSRYSFNSGYCLSPEKVRQVLRELEPLVNNIGTEEILEMENSGQMDIDKYPEYSYSDVDIENDIIAKTLHENLEYALSELTDRERKVIELRFGLLDSRPLTLEEVGHKLGVTGPRVRQIEAKAIRKLYRSKGPLSGLEGTI